MSLPICIQARYSKPRAIKTEPPPVIPPPNGQVFMYGGQRLNYTELQKAELRRRIDRDRGRCFAYSTEFATLSLDDCDTTPEQRRRAEEKESAQRFLVSVSVRGGA